jgi:hypothetical protein
MPVHDPVDRGGAQAVEPFDFYKCFRSTTSPMTKCKASSLNSRGDSKANSPPVVSTSARKVVAQNLVNMVVVMAGSGTVLLGLLAAKHFQITQF